MNKNAYLSQLRTLLTGLSEEDIQEVLSDYELHFQYAYEEGLTDEAIIESLGPVETLAKQYNQLKPVDHSAITSDAEIVEDEISEELSVDEAIIDVEPVPVENSPHTEFSQNAQRIQKPVHSIESHSSNHTQSNQIQNKGRNPLGSLFIAVLLIFLNVTFILGPFIALWAVCFSFFIAGLAFVAEAIKMIVMTSTVTDYSAGLSEVTLITQIGFYMTFGSCVSLLMVKLAKAFGILTKKYVLWNVKLVKGEV